ncbi:ammonia channel protein [Verrucomicrobia bacterium IMCC26134]|nr:ammonia channel protein [Verrucomicrobia bacterium IMCC26134]
MKAFAFYLLLTLSSVLPFTSTAAETTGAAPAVASTGLGTRASLPPPDVEQRLGDLEAYINNAARVTDGQAVSKIPGGGPGHSAWMMTSCALVLFMTLPGLALFYGGLVRRKNVLSILAQCLGLTGVVSLIWWACGYSLSFSTGNPVIGDLSFAFLRDVGLAPNPNYAQWVPHNLFAIYQMMFAIITPALTVGAIAERMKFKAIMLFSVIWMFVVYFPVAHMLWGAGGLMNGLFNPTAAIKAIDFAGGIVVHMTSGWSALALCILLGKRLGHGREHMAPHSLVFCMAGTGMLWVGWYGFNAGSAVAADGVAVNAFVTTTLAAAAGCFMWPFLEYLRRGKPSVLGFCSGAVAGLATITPASGFVTAGTAILIGLVAGAATYFACNHLKSFFKYDDSLDTFGVHAVGGTIGTLLAGIFATTAANPNLANGPIAALVGKTLWLEQLKAGGIVLVWSVGATFVIAKLVGWVCGGLRVDGDDETLGLDLAEHGEEGYIIE